MPTAEDILISAEAGGHVIRGSALRVASNVAGIAVGLATATLLLRHLGVAESGRYVTVMSLVAIAVSVIDTGLNVSGSNELALRQIDNRKVLIANILAQRLIVAPIALALIVGFSLLASYPGRMVLGTALAGAGVFIVALANALLLRLTVELRNGGLAFVDFLRQIVTFAGVALLVALGAHLTALLAVQIVVGLAVAGVTPLLVGTAWLVVPRFDRAVQRTLLGTALPVAAALALGQIYFRLVIVLMSIVSSPRQTGYFGGSLRAMETLINIPILVAGVALPLLTAAARDDRGRLRYAVRGLAEGAVIAGVLLVLVTARMAEPVMAIIGGGAFRAAGAVLRIQVGALLFIALYQIWTAALIALGRQRELILTNSLSLFGVSAFAAVLVPLAGAQGGAVASVLGDALLACLIYWRLHVDVGGIMVRAGFLLRVAVSAFAASVPLAITALPAFLATALAGIVFLVTGHLVGMLPAELRDAFGGRGSFKGR